ncbi:hypothetical protein C8Q74DRAFT_850696 [Fomes fomentarius]|nr:hypothetical protein C8Q74DRAFT_850696 [Fomes fomentarius]
MSERHRSRTSRQIWRWFRSQISSLWLLQRWGEHQLVHARAVKFRSISGYVNEPAVRKGNAIGVKWTMLDIFFFCVSWLLSAVCGYVPVLQVCRYAGRGSTATAYRGHYCGVRFVVKKPVEGEVAWREWRGLVARLPNDLAALSQLPIPRYYGLFGGELDNVIVMSDCGSPISPLALDEEMRCVLILMEILLRVLC